MPEKSPQHSGDKEAKSAAEEEWKSPSDEESGGEGTGWIELPDEADFWRPPARFGSIPVEKEPMGWDRRLGFRKLFPRISLPFQVVERVRFGHPELNPNRLFCGDNLQVMRSLPAETIDLIYADPPFFSQREYSVVWGDEQEKRSFSDVWKDGLNGYLTWLAPRLAESKRLLKKTGSLYLHCDWHAGHYIKVELDKIFGYHNFRNEIIWHYFKPHASKARWPRNFDTLFHYGKSRQDSLTQRDKRRKTKFNHEATLFQYDEKAIKRYDKIDEDGRRYKLYKEKDGTIRKAYMKAGVSEGVLKIPFVQGTSKERVGYRTQKPEALLERIVLASSDEGDVVGDFFCGGGTTPAVAQRLGRRFIACDQSRAAVSVTRDRLIDQAEQTQMNEKSSKAVAVPDFTLENWGVYEAKALSKMPPETFRAFVLKCFGAKGKSEEAGVHGWKGPVPVWVGSSKPRERVSAADVKDFANAVRQTARYKQTNLREGIMLAWAFRADAKQAAEQLRKLEEVDFHFIRLDLTRIDSQNFREDVAKLAGKYADYASFLTFVSPPQVEVGVRRLRRMIYKFDASDTIVMNADPKTKIANVQWDFKYNGRRFRSTEGYSFAREKDGRARLWAQYEFARAGKHWVACRVQDDKGGEGFWKEEIEVS